jgi:hypothetical protein
MAVAGSAILVALSVPADARPDTRTMTCAQANQLVRQRGAVVMSTGQHTFRRFVASRAYCDPWEVRKTFYAPTRDARQCPISGVCEEPVWRLRPFGRD